MEGGRNPSPHIPYIGPQPRNLGCYEPCDPALKQIIVTRRDNTYTMPQIGQFPKSKYSKERIIPETSGCYGTHKSTR